MLTHRNLYSPSTKARSTREKYPLWLKYSLPDFMGFFIAMCLPSSKPTTWGHMFLNLNQFSSTLLDQLEESNIRDEIPLRWHCRPGGQICRWSFFQPSWYCSEVYISPVDRFLRVTVSFNLTSIGFLKFSSDEG